MTETVSRVREAGASGQLTVRADRAFYSKAVLPCGCPRHTAVALDVRFSITAQEAAGQANPRRHRGHRRAAWQPIPYWLSSPEVSGADVAETTYTAFTGKHALTVRLIVRRVRPTPGSQLALFTTWSYHAFVTDRPGQMLELEADHRRHAIVEQTIAELKSAGLAHLPSGHFMANAAWLALAVMAHNLGRAVGDLAGPDLQRRPPPPCSARSSPCPAGWSAPAAAGATATRELALGRGDQHRAARMTTIPLRC